MRSMHISITTCMLHISISFIVSAWLGSVMIGYSCNYTRLAGSQVDRCQGYNSDVSAQSRALFSELMMSWSGVSSVS